MTQFLADLQMNTAVKVKNQRLPVELLLPLVHQRFCPYLPLIRPAQQIVYGNSKVIRQTT